MVLSWALKCRGNVCSDSDGTRNSKVCRTVPTGASPIAAHHRALDHQEGDLILQRRSKSSGFGDEVLARARALPVCPRPEVLLTHAHAW
jgi:hypothetical protein